MVTAFCGGIPGGSRLCLCGPLGGEAAGLGISLEFRHPVLAECVDLKVVNHGVCLL